MKAGLAMKQMLVLAALCSALPAAAQVYKCKDASGVTVFASQPCGPGAQSIDVRPASGPQAPEIPRTQIYRRARDLKIGMSADEARKIWGGPRNVNRSTTAAGVREQWVYGYGYKNEYLYFVNGVLVTIQD